MLRKIYYFIRVAYLGNMSHAANELFISQPSLSMAIKQLENEWGVTLFERSSNKITLSSDGKRILPYAESVYNEYLTLKSALAIKTDEAKPIAVGSGMSHVADIVEWFEREYDETLFLHQYYDYYDLRNALVTKKVDVVICSPPIEGKGISTKVLVEEPLCIVVNENHPLCAKTRLPIESVLQYPFITLPAKFPVRMAIDQAFYKVGLKPRYSVEAENSVIHSLLSKGRKEYISIYPLSKARTLNKLHGLRYIPIEEDEFSRIIAISQLSSSVLSDSLDKFISVTEFFYATSPNFSSWGNLPSDNSDSKEPHTE